MLTRKEFLKKTAGATGAIAIAPGALSLPDEPESPAGAPSVLRVADIPVARVESWSAYTFDGQRLVHVGGHKPQRGYVSWRRCSEPRDKQLLGQPPSA